MKKVITLLLVNLCLITINSQLPTLKKPNLTQKDNGNDKGNNSNSETINPDTKKGANDRFYQLWSYSSKIDKYRPDTDILLKYADSLNYTNYLKEKENFKNKYKEDCKCGSIEKFYNEDFPEYHKPALLEIVRKDIKKAEKNYDLKAPEMITKLDATRQIIDAILKIKPDDIDFLAEIKNIDDLKLKIQSYIDSGEYEKNLADIEKGKLDNVKMEPAKMSDANVTKVVMNGVDQAKYGKPEKVNITNSTWQYKKTNAGVILNKYVFVHVGTEKDGKCYLHTGWVRQDYNNGSYGSMYYDPAQFLEQMNCDNQK